jgi:hypothetical protein
MYSKLDDLNLKTGDLLLFSETSNISLFNLFLNMIKYGTKSEYVHIAMVLVDPTFIHPSLKGTYVWESSWEGKPDPQDGKTKLGVQITPINEIIDAYKDHGHVFLRRVSCEKYDECFSNDNLEAIHKVVYNRPYDIVPKDWFHALTCKDPNPQKTDRFWCSALVGYIYTKCGILNEDTDWSIMRPSDFAIDGERLSLNTGNSLDNSETRIY